MVQYISAEKKNQLPIRDTLLYFSVACSLGAIQFRNKKKIVKHRGIVKAGFFALILPSFGGLHLENNNNNNNNKRCISVNT